MKLMRIGMRHSARQLSHGVFKLPALVVLVPVVLACVFLPEIYVISWHLRHGSSVSFIGRSVYVPLRWVGTANDVEVSLIKYPRTFLFGTWPIGGITISKAIKTSANHGAVLENWRRAQAALSLNPNFSVSERDESNLSCVQRTEKRTPDRMYIDCLSSSTMLYTQFIGRAKDAPEYLDIVRALANPVAR